MGQGERGEVHRQIQTLFHTGTVVGLSDGQLLEKFTTEPAAEAERAFAALVQRHGPTVLRVCRGVLRNSHDAEDAFQATFLILASKARSIRLRNSVGSWLYGVALRVASDLRFVAARRRSHEGRVAAGRHEAVDGDSDDSSQVVLEELGRLPDRLRAAVVLCYLEGHTCEEAAHQLGWPLGTVKTRLGQARGRLRDRLIRRGVAPLMASTALASSSAEAMPLALEVAVVHAARGFASCKATAGVVSPSVLALVEGVQTAMLLTRIKLGVAAALAIGTVVTGTSVVARSFVIDSVRPAPVLERSEAVDRTNGPERGLAAKAEQPILAAADPLPVLPDLGGQDDFEVRGRSQQELQVRLAHAKQLLEAKQTLFKRGTIPQSGVDEVRLEVDILQARLEASKQDLEDELERLEARVRVKRAEADAAKIRSVWAQQLHSPQNPNGAEVAQSKADIAVREAELMEVEIRIKQVKRRLGLK